MDLNTIVPGLYVNEDEKTIYLTEDITNETMGALANALLAFEADDDAQEAALRFHTREPIKLYINTSGGAVYDAFGVIGIIESMTTEVWTFCNGYAMSAGFALFCSGTYRFLYPYSTLMIHEVSQGADIETFTARKASLEQFERVNERFLKYILGRTNIDEEKIREAYAKQKDTYYEPEEALELGIATNMFDEYYDIYADWKQAYFQELTAGCFDEDCDCKKEKK